MSGKSIYQFKVMKDLEDLIPGFLSNREKEVEKFQELLRQSDFEEIRAMAHTMKGVCGGYGFHLLSDIGEKIEVAAQGGDIASLTELIQKYAYILDHHQILFTEEDS